MKILYSLVLILLLFCGCFYIDANYIETASGIEIPKRRYSVDSYDSGEFYVVGHFKLTKDVGRKFFNEYGFRNDFHASLEDIFGLHSLKPENQIEPEGYDPYYVKGFSGTNSWLFIYDINSDRIWCVTLYPDWSGDKPTEIVLKSEKKARWEEIKMRIQSKAEPVAGGDATR